MLTSASYEKTIKGASVDTKAIRRLKPGTWLDDSVVAFYGTLLTNRSEEAEKKGEFGEREERLKKVWCFNSFFWTMYNENGYKRVKKWTKKVRRNVSLIQNFLSGLTDRGQLLRTVRRV